MLKFNTVSLHWILVENGKEGQKLCRFCKIYLPNGAKVFFSSSSCYHGNFCLKLRWKWLDNQTRKIFLSLDFKYWINIWIVMYGVFITLMMIKMSGLFDPKLLKLNFNSKNQCWEKDEPKIFMINFWFKSIGKNSIIMITGSSSEKFQDLNLSS